MRQTLAQMLNAGNTGRRYLWLLLGVEFYIGTAQDCAARCRSEAVPYDTVIASYEMV